MTIWEKDLEHYRSMVEMALQRRADRPSDLIYVETRLDFIIQGYKSLLASLDIWFTENPHQLPPGYGADIRPDIHKEISNYQPLLEQVRRG